MTMNTTWAVNELQEFLSRCRLHTTAYNGGGEYAYRDPAIQAIHDDVIGRMAIVEKIADRGWPGWRDHLPKQVGVGWECDRLAKIANQTLVKLERQEELEQNLGDAGPKLSATTMHSDVWDAAQSLWRNGHFRESVLAAARSVNAAIQTKVARRDTSEFDLVTQSFTA
jgi:Protein of unknown function (Hypoth_ymh)